MISLWMWILSRGRTLSISASKRILVRRALRKARKVSKYLVQASGERPAERRRLWRASCLRVI